MPSQPEVNAVVAEILEIAEAEVHDDSDLEQLGWDSLSNLTLVSIADERWRTRVDTARLARCETPAELLRLLG